MAGPGARPRSLFVYHLHMGGPDADALEWRALLSSRYTPRLAQLGVALVPEAAHADIVVLTGVLTEGNLEMVLETLARMPQPSVLVAAGSAAINGGQWSKAGLPGLTAFPISHYADVQVTVPGDPPTPQAFVAGLSAAASALRSTGPEAGGTAWED